MGVLRREEWIKNNKNMWQKFWLRTIMVAIAGISLKAGDGGEEKTACNFTSLLAFLSFVSCPAKALQVSANGKREREGERERDEVGWMFSFIHLVMSNIVA